MAMFLLRKRISYTDWTDAELIANFRISGSGTIIDEFYRRYGHLVMGCGLKYLRNRPDAEDMTIAVFSALPEKIRKHEISYFKSWLYTLTKNECLQVLRRKRYRTQELDDRLQEEEFESPLEPKLQLLEQGIEQLKGDQRICIEAFYLYNLSYQEISDKHDISLLKVKSAIQNGKRNLKIWMENNQTHEEAFDN